MSKAKAEELGLEWLATLKSFVTVGVDPSIMGIGPIPAVKKLLAKTGLSMGDIDLIELNEAFASQTVYIRDKLGLDPEKLNVNGGAISIGHPYGMTGARQVGAQLG